MWRQEYRAAGAQVRRRFCRLSLAVALAAPVSGVALLAGAPFDGARAADARRVAIGENRVGAVRVTQGKSETLRTSRGFVDLVVGDPEIADVMPLDGRDALRPRQEDRHDQRLRLRRRPSSSSASSRSRSATTRRALPPTSPHDAGAARVGSANGRTVLSGEMPDARRGRQGRRPRQAIRPRGAQPPQGARTAAGDARGALRRGVAQRRQGSRRQLGGGRQEFLGRDRHGRGRWRPAHSLRRPDRPRPVRRRPGRRPRAGARGSRPRAPSRRAEPDRHVGREGELPGRRRVSRSRSPARSGPHHRRLQEVRRRPHVHADRSGERRHQSAASSRRSASSTSPTRSARRASRCRR